MIQVNHLPGKPFARCVEVLVLRFLGFMSWVETIPAPNMERLTFIKQSLDVYQIACMRGTFPFLEWLYLPNLDQDGLVGLRPLPLNWTNQSKQISCD